MNVFGFLMELLLIIFIVGLFGEKKLILGSVIWKNYPLFLVDFVWLHEFGSDLVMY